MLVTLLLLLFLLAVPVLIGVVVVLLLVGVESINKEEDVLRLCFLVVVAGVILMGVAAPDADDGVGNNLDTDEGLRRCFFVLETDLLGVL